MGNQIVGPPNVYNMGLDFDYSVWTPGTQVNLVSVNWDNTYRDVTKFDTPADRDAWFNSRVSGGITIQNLTYAKPGEDVYLPIPYSAANRYNYLRASNPLMPGQDADIRKDYFYFILDCEMIAPGNTRLRLQLDVWQTYVYDVTFGNCYVERGHIAIANTKAWDNYGRDYLTVPEGLDVGSEMRIIAKRTQEVMTTSAGDFVSECNVLVVSTIDLEAPPGTQDDPNQKVGTPSQVNGLPSGATFYLFPSFLDFQIWADGMRDYSWVLQGIVSITAVPSVRRYMPNYDYGTAPYKVTTLNPAPVKHDMFTDWRNDDEIWQYLTDRYRHLRKFFTFPYMAIEITTWSGTPILLKPESWWHNDAQLMERATYMLPNQRVQFIPRRYNTSNQVPDAYFNATEEQLVQTRDAIEALGPPVGGTEVAYAWYNRYKDLGDDYGDYLDMITQIADFPSLPIVNNQSINYLASNAHGIAAQYKSGDWTQQRAMAGAQASYDVATGALGAAQNQAGIEMNADISQTALANRTLGAQAAMSAAGQLATGIGNAITPQGFGPGSAVAGGSAAAVTGVNAAIQAMSNDEAQAIRGNAAGQSIINSTKQGTLARDTNNDLAKFAARGDYSNTINVLNAKVQDANLIQPSMAGQYGGDAANIAFGTMEVSVRWKFVDNAARRIIGEFWLRYGYAIRAFITPPPSLRVMSKFTYWKMTETYIKASNIPERHKQALRGIMEKGVTVWTNPTDIGSIDLADNTPLGGISY